MIVGEDSFFYTEIKKECMDAIIYTAIQDAVLTLRNSKKIHNQNHIRNFILESYKLYLEGLKASVNQEISQEDMQIESL